MDAGRVVLSISRFRQAGGPSAAGDAQTSHVGGGRRPPRVPKRVGRSATHWICSVITDKGSVVSECVPKSLWIERMRRTNGRRSFTHIPEPTLSPQRKEQRRVAGASDLAVRSQDLPPAANGLTTRRGGGSYRRRLPPPERFRLLFVCSFLLGCFYFFMLRGYAGHLGAWTFDPAPRTAHQ